MFGLTKMILVAAPASDTNPAPKQLAPQFVRDYVKHVSLHTCLSPHKTCQVTSILLSLQKTCFVARISLAGVVTSIIFATKIFCRDEPNQFCRDDKYTFVATKVCLS